MPTVRLPPKVKKEFVETNQKKSESLDPEKEEEKRFRLQSIYSVVGAVGFMLAYVLYQSGILSFDYEGTEDDEN